jgi:3-oxoacyl-[acyl-carrier-protein] synthase II
VTVRVDYNGGRRVVITGLGVVSAAGNDVGAFQDAILAGQSAVSTIQSFDASSYRSRIAGEIHGFEPLDFFDAKAAARIDRFAQFAVVAAGQALGDSRLASTDRLRSVAGITLGTGLGGIGSNDHEFKAMYTRGPRAVSPWAIPMIMYNAAASHLAMRFGMRGPNSTVTTACSSSSNALGQSYRMIKHGYVDVMVVVGADAPISPGILAAWCALRALSTRNDQPQAACRPFSADRDGLVLAEGAAAIVLESLESAAGRDVHVYGEIAGYGCNTDGFHITQPAAEQEAMAIAAALEEAAVAPDAVDYVSAHGTGTTLSDRAEAAALRQVFGPRLRGLPVSSLKSMLGHHMGASGAFQMLATLLMMAARKLHPTINHMVPDPECDLDCVPNEGRRAEPRTALVNSFGFGGNNAVLVVKKCEA